MSDYCDTVHARTLQFRGMCELYNEALAAVVDHLNKRGSIDSVSSTGKSNKGRLAEWYREQGRLQYELVPLREEMLRFSGLLVELAGSGKETF